ncbi:MAG: hypothetical protein PHS79_05980 [Patescibacteria group bacterium]|nr:hypothetical protein [Patescibacteria group bacterium]
MKTAKLILLLILPLVSWFLLPPRANALTVSPVLVNQDIAPGTRANGKMLIINDGTQTQTYYVSVQSFVPIGEEGEQQYLDENIVSGLPSWFRFAQTTYTVGPLETVEVPYSIAVPQNGEPGGHYATVFFSTNPNEASQGTSINIAAKTGILYLINVSGNVKEMADIESFRVNQNIFSHLPAMMSLRIRNTGSVHFIPVGTLTVRNIFGGIVARVPTNPKKSAVLPNSIRRLDTWWTKSEIIETEGFFAGVINEWRNFAIGRYTATVDVKYGSLNTSLPAQVATFWVIPWRLITIFFALAILLIVLMKLYNKMIVSSALKRSSKKK